MQKGTEDNEADPVSPVTPITLQTHIRHSGQESPIVCGRREGMYVSMRLHMHHYIYTHTQGHRDWCQREMGV